MKAQVEKTRRFGLHPPEDLRHQLERIADTLNVQLKWREDEEGNMMVGVKTLRGELWTHLSSYDLNPWHSAFARLGLIDRTEEDYTDYTYPVVDPPLPPNPGRQYSASYLSSPKSPPVTHHADPKNQHQTLCGKWNMPNDTFRIAQFDRVATCVECERRWQNAHLPF